MAYKDTCWSLLASTSLNTFAVSEHAQTDPHLTLPTTIRSQIVRNKFEVLRVLGDLILRLRHDLTIPGRRIEFALRTILGHNGDVRVWLGLRLLL